jgi:hypothetical protein
MGGPRTRSEAVLTLFANAMEKQRDKTSLRGGPLTTQIGRCVEERD